MRKKVLTILFSAFSAFAVHAGEVLTHYWDPFTEKTINTYATPLEDVLDNSKLIVSAGTYLIRPGCSISSSVLHYVDDKMPDARCSLIISAYNTVTLILADGAEFNVPRGLFIDNGAVLTIYAQSPASAANCGKMDAGYESNYKNAEMAGIETMGGLVINGGRINAKGAKYCAGIGLGKCNKTTAVSHRMNVTINGGLVTANGGDYGAGIGGQGHEDVQMKGEIKIAGGTVYATGGYEAAGIGGGDDGSSCKITITGGEIHAKGGKYAAGIGGGDDGGCADIAISGGTVESTGGAEAAGIGSGNGYDNSDVGTIRISGGSVTAMAGDYASESAGYGLGAAIGTGDDNKFGISIFITGGLVHAWGARRAACIGGGEYCSSGQILISGGHVIVHPNPNNGQCIGPGYDAAGGSFRTGPGGHAIIESPSIYDRSDEANWWCIWRCGSLAPVMYAGADNEPRQFTLLDDLDLNVTRLSVPENVQLMIGGNVRITGDGIIDLENTATLSGNVYGALVANKSQVKRNIFASVSLLNITSSLNNGYCSVESKNFKFRLTPKAGYQLPYTISIQTGGLSLMEGQYTYDRETGDVEILSQEIVGRLVVTATAFTSDSDFYVPITPSTTQLLNNAYVVNGDVTIDRPLAVDGSVLIFSAAGSKLTVNGGMTLERGALLMLMPLNGKCGKIICNGISKNAGIYVPEQATLMIKDADLEATGADQAAGIGGIAHIGMGSILIYGGKIKATGGDCGAGIGSGRESDCGTIKISPEKEVVIDALGGIWATGIGAGYMGDGGEIVIEGGFVTARSASVGDQYPGIGATKEGKTGKFSTTTNGTAFIRTTTIKADRSNQDEWSGIIFEEYASGGGYSGYVYKDQTVDYDIDLKLNDKLRIPTNTTLTIKRPGKLTGSGALDLSEGGTYVGAMERSVDVRLNDFGKKIYTEEYQEVLEGRNVSLSVTAEKVLLKMLGREVFEGVNVYSATNTVTPLTNSIASLNKAVSVYEGCLDKYIIDITSDEEKASNNKGIQINEPKITITSLGVDEDSVNFEISITGARFKPNVSAKVWMSDTPRFEMSNTGPAGSGSGDSSAGTQVNPVKIATSAPALGFTLSSHRDKAEFSAEKPAEARFFKVEMVPAQPDFVSR